LLLVDGMPSTFDNHELALRMSLLQYASLSDSAGIIVAAHNQQDWTTNRSQGVDVSSWALGCSFAQFQHDVQPMPFTVPRGVKSTQ